jgi:hypothetical protein
MYDAKLCDDCWSKVQNQPKNEDGVQYAMCYEELCNPCKAANDELRKTQETL